MKIIKYSFIPLLVIALMFTGCSKSPDTGKNDSAAKSKVYWTCTMHPQIHMDRPGTCPICGMELVKRVEGEEEKTLPGKDTANTITLSSKKQVLANVSTIIVKKEMLHDEVTAYSYLDFVESNRKTISARFNGRIEKLFVDQTGDQIKKGEALFEIYSPDLVQAQNDYLIALGTGTNSGNLIEAAKKKLQLFGLTDTQIQNLEKTRTINLTLTYYSPISGTVIEKKVQEGMYVNEGTPIYDVADLSTLWNIADVYENDLASIKVGSPVKLHLRAYPGEEFNGRVTFIYPVVNPQTRTIKVRSEFSNYGGKLKPQMYGETVFSRNAGEGLLVPSDAVIIAGERSVVWVKISNNTFEARKVTLGNRFGDKYQILSGINEGDKIAATGAFLIDSESQLKTGSPVEQQSGSQKQNSSPGSMPGMKM